MGGVHPVSYLFFERLRFLTRPVVRGVRRVGAEGGTMPVRTCAVLLFGCVCSPVIVFGWGDLVIRTMFPSKHTAIMSGNCRLVSQDCVFRSAFAAQQSFSRKRGVINAKKS